jgi:Zn-finger nucleic acid-binding protein
MSDKDAERFPLKLVACSNCHTQYDVAEMAADARFDCHCGEEVQVVSLKGDDAPVQRCSACGALAREEDENCGYCGSSIVHIGDRGSLICPECFARNADDARFCLACGVGFQPVSIEPLKSELRCPSCDRCMAMRVVGGLEIQECESCHGLWAPEDRFEALVDRATKLVRDKALAGEVASPRVNGGNPADHKVQYRRCPECKALMGRRNFRKRSGVIIDQCHEHGTWLDAHELERIAGFVLSGRAGEAERMLAAEESERERGEARQAAQRIVLGTEYEKPSSMFSPRTNRSTVGTLLDLLQNLLT